MLKTQFFIGMALLAGVAIGYFARPSDAVTSDADEEYVPKKRIAETRGTADERALRRRIAKLERALSEKDAMSEVAISNAVAEAVKNVAPDGRPRGNPREWMENLKKTDPERFTQMTNRFAQWRQRRLDRARNRIDFLFLLGFSAVCRVCGFGQWDMECRGFLFACSFYALDAVFFQGFIPCFIQCCIIVLREFFSDAF